ncbi:MAG: UpxY family transcription antiterminator [Bacteroidales bacterium]|nr:UpxY family transcription antiterminator [Candidatus Liminaster caballi]
MIETDNMVRDEALVSPSAHADGCPQELSVSEREAMRWFVMRAVYCRELKAKALLDEEGVMCFVPMRKVRNDDGRFESVPAVHNYIFVRTCREFMDGWKKEMEFKCPVRYCIDPATGKPMFVRDREMDDFIRVTQDVKGDGIIYLDNPGVAVTKGKSVEVVAGKFKGVQGKILRILRDRKVVLSIGGVVSVAISGIPFRYMKEI